MCWFRSITKVAAFFTFIAMHATGTNTAFADPGGTPPPPTSPTIANARIENFEHQSFELRLLNPQPAPAPSPPGGFEQSRLGDPPRGACIIIGSSRTGDCR
jgi:hypothetical protein